MASSKLPEQHAKHVKYLRDQLKRQIAEYDKAAHTLKLLSYLVQYPQFKPLRPYISDWLYDGKPNLEVYVKSFPEILPVLEQLAGWGCDFNETQDSPSYGERKYISDKCIVTANLVEGSADCRRVIIGYHEPSPPRPIYKFECGPGEPLPPVSENPTDPTIPTDPTDPIKPSEAV